MDVVVTDPITGRATGLARTVARACSALDGAGIRYTVIGAAALAVRGFPRMTRDLDVVVLADDGRDAARALTAAGLRQETPGGGDDGPEAMIVFVDPATGVEVDLLVAYGDPEATVIDEAERTALFGVEAPVASLEHLLLLYLYSNQPKHLGDFATIVRSGVVDLASVERQLGAMHPEMVGDWQRRVSEARNPPPAPPRPPARRKR